MKLSISYLEFFESNGCIKLIITTNQLPRIDECVFYLQSVFFRF